MIGATLKSIVVVLLFTAAARADLGPSSFSYEGRLYDANGDAVTDPTVSFKLQVLDASATCVIYEETFSKDLGLSHGLFSLQLGHGTVTAGLSATLRDALVNVPGSRTVNGCTYTVSAADDRKVKVFVTDAAAQTSEFSQTLSIGSAAYAMVADTVQGLTPANLLQVNAASDVTQANLESVFAAGGFSNLQKLAAGQYTERSSSGTVLPSFSAPPATLPPAGTIWFDTASKSILYSTGIAVVPIETPLNVVTAVTAGTGLTGGTITSTGTIAVAPGGIGTAQLAPDLSITTSGSLTASSAAIGSISTSNLYLSDTNAHRIALRAPALTGDWTLTLPNTIGPVATALTSDGSGGTFWGPVGTLSSLNGLSGSTQTLSIGTSGTAPSWISGGGTHVLNLPSASATGTTAGLISNTEYNLFSSKQSADLATGAIWIGNAAGLATPVVPSADVAITTTGVSTVKAIQGKPVSNAAPTTNGQTLRWAAGAWTPSFLSLADIRSTAVPGNTILPASSCGANQTLNWTSLTDSFSCQSIAIAAGQITYPSVAAGSVFAAPSASTGLPGFRSLALSDLPPASITQWTTSGTNISYATGNVGIGTNAPSVKLQVAGTLLIGNGNESCSTTLTGAVRFNAPNIEICGGSAWSALAPLNSVLTSLTGDVSSTGTGVAVVSVNKVNGVSYPAAGAVNTLPIMGASNQVSYQLVPNASLVNSALVIGSTSIPLGATAPSITGLTSLASNTVTVGSALKLHGTSSDITLQNLGGGPAYNFNLPASAGSSGQVLLSGGGASNPMTWGTLTVDSGGTGLSGGVSGAIPYFASTGTMASSSVLAAHAVTVGGGAGAAPATLTSTGLAGNSLISNGANTDPSWTAVNLAGGATSVTGILATANGGTGSSSLNGAGLWVNGGNSFGTAANLGTTDANDFSIHTNAAPRVTILSSGAVGIGTTNPVANVALDVGTSSAILMPRGATSQRPSGAVNGMIRYNSDSDRVEVYQNGGWLQLPANFNFLVSDRRLKTNIESVATGLEMAEKMNPVYYDWDATNPRTSAFEKTHQIGFIAQELEVFLPEVVHIDGSDYRSVEYSKIVAVAIAAIKELKARQDADHGISLAYQNETENLKAQLAKAQTDAASAKAKAEALQAYLCGKDGAAPFCSP